MRLKKRQSQRVAVKKTIRLHRPGKYDAEKGLIGVPRPPADTEGRRSDAGAVPVSTAEPKLIRRQDYADVYQIGKRTSSGKNATLPGGTISQPDTAIAVAVTAFRWPARRPRFQPRFIIIAACAALLAVAAISGATLLKAQAGMASGQEVFFGGRLLCIAANRTVAEKAMQQIQDDLKKSYGMDVQTGGELTFTPVSCDRQNILDETGIEGALKDNLNVKVMAAVITVNDRPAVALRTNDEAQQTLDAILKPFQNAPADLSRTDVSFVENVQVQQMPIDYALVQTVDAAVHALTLGSNVEDNPYDVKKGDSLAKIASKFKLKISDILKANPSIASADVLQPGQTLNAVKPNNWVNVRYTETVTRQEALPFDTVEQETATLYTTQKKVTQEGKNGQREVVARVTYINGMEALKEILNQTVISAAQNEIVLRGTKKVPANAGGGTSISGKFIPPVKDYTITSVFEKRTLQGVTRWHYGIDMAAPKGTPIYASRSGTVEYSGSASGYGLVVYIDHGNGVQTRYGHCSKLLVTKGQKVTQGQLIALVGSTGHSTGPHCHFEMRINGTPVDPRKYVKL